jgi:hypothetical protein
LQDPPVSNVANASRLDFDPRSEPSAVGDDPHIAIVTFTTDAEDGVDYQRRRPSVRRWERERQLLLGLRTPGPSSR